MLAGILIVWVLMHSIQQFYLANKKLLEPYYLQSHMIKAKASGKRWEDVGTKAPSSGGKYELNGKKYEKLQKKLSEGQTTFEEEEWKEFGIKGLRMGHFIKVQVGNKYKYFNQYSY